MPAKLEVVLDCRLQGLPSFEGPGDEQAPEAIIDGLLKVLFAPEIPLCREDGRVSEQELNLFYLSAGRMTQLCTGSA